MLGNHCDDPLEFLALLFLQYQKVSSTFYAEVAKIDGQPLQSRTLEAYKHFKGFYEHQGLPMWSLEVPMKYMHTNFMQNSVTHNRMISAPSVAP